MGPRRHQTIALEAQDELVAGSAAGSLVMHEDGDLAPLLDDPLAIEQRGTEPTQDNPFRTIRGGSSLVSPAAGDMEMANVV